MYYYFVRRKDGSIYPTKSEKHLIREHLNDPLAKEVVPIGFFEYLKIKYLGRAKNKED